MVKREQEMEIRTENGPTDMITQKVRKWHELQVYLRQIGSQGAQAILEVVGAQISQQPVRIVGLLLDLDVHVLWQQLRKQTDHIKHF